MSRCDIWGRRGRESCPYDHSTVSMFLYKCPEICKLHKHQAQEVLAAKSPTITTKLQPPPAPAHHSNFSPTSLSLSSQSFSRFSTPVACGLNLASKMAAWLRKAPEWSLRPGSRAPYKVVEAPAAKELQSNSRHRLPTERHSSNALTFCEHHLPRHVRHQPALEKRVQR